MYSYAQIHLFLNVRSSVLKDQNSATK